MAIEVFQGTNPTVYVNLTTPPPENLPFNASGYALYLGAKETYSDTDYMFYVGATGTGIAGPDAATGLFAFPLTTGDTSYCVGSYPCGLTLVSPSGVISKTSVEGGFVILPTV